MGLFLIFIHVQLTLGLPYWVTSEKQQLALNAHLVKNVYRVVERICTVLVYRFDLAKHLFLSHNSVKGLQRKLSP